MSSCLIVCHGYFGDHIFASSIAKKLIEEKQFEYVDYTVGWPQILPFFYRNPYIRDTYLGNIGPSPKMQCNNPLDYEKIFQIKPILRITTPCKEMQRMCGVDNPSSEYIVYTDPQLDSIIKEKVDAARQSSGKPVLAIMNGWQPKAFLFTKEQYKAGIDVPYKGYGGALRDIPRIIDALVDRYAVIMVGAPENVKQNDSLYSGRSLDEEASIIKACDFFIGAEGGLANIAGGVGTRTILTSDYVHQLYGWNGVMQKLEEPQLGPKYYFPNDGHIDLDPYLTDDEVINQIISIVG